jgi:hypothetical protein
MTPVELIAQLDAEAANCQSRVLLEQSAALATVPMPVSPVSQWRKAA